MALNFVWYRTWSCLLKKKYISPVHGLTLVFAYKSDSTWNVTKWSEVMQHKSQSIKLAEINGEDIHMTSCLPKICQVLSVSACCNSSMLPCASISNLFSQPPSLTPTSTYLHWSHVESVIGNSSFRVAIYFFRKIYGESYFVIHLKKYLHI
jgi:hypothetical protein